jgi:hypothetical protein
MLQCGDDAERLRIMVETAMGLETGIQRPLAGVSKGGMTEVMGQRQRLREVLVESELTRQSARNLGMPRRPHRGLCTI